MRKIKNLIEYFKYLKNPINPLKLKFGLIEKCDVKIKGTENILTISNAQILDRLMHLLPLTPKEKYDELIEYITDLNNDEEYITINKIKYVNFLNSEFKENNPYSYNACNKEYFSDDDWNMINFQDRQVIDIGGNVADSALDFANQGADVIAFEPVKHLYEIALENISLNPSLSNKITFINKAVGSKKGKIDITANSLKNYVSGDVNYEIDVITIDDILNEYEIKPDILKMNCEGCEFEIIPQTDLSIFNEVIFEHHAKIAGKDYKPLIEILKKQGFKINTYPCNSSRSPFKEIGIMHLNNY
nr:FkbM family methyltransferase [uncultured Methanobrevibacter sp.]